MRHYFSPYQNGSFRVRHCITLPITLNEDLVRANEHFNFSQRFDIKQFQSLQDLDRLIELGHDRQLWKHLCNDISEAAQADFQSRSRSERVLYLYRNTSKNLQPHYHPTRISLHLLFIFFHLWRSPIVFLTDMALEKESMNKE